MARKKAVYTEAHRASGASRTHQKKVRDVMTPRVVAVTSVTFLPEAAQIMREEDVGALPVVQEDGKLMGIVTDRDITVRGVAAGGDLLHKQIGEIYTAEDLVTVTPDTDLDEAEQLMSEHQVRRLPIVEADNKLVGMIAMADIVRQDSKRDSGQVLRQISKAGGEHAQGQ